MTTRPFRVVALLALLVSPALADQAYYAIPLDRLTTVERIDPPDESNATAPWRRQQAMCSYAVLDGGAEAYVVPDSPRERWEPSPGLADSHLAVQSAPTDQLSGTLTVRSDDRAGVSLIRFTVSTADFKSDRNHFLQAKRSHYQQLLDRQFPGAAWFRHQIRQINLELGQDGEIAEPMQRWPGRNEDGLTETFALFGGGRAISENLQLDRALAPTTQFTDLSVDTQKIPGIIVQEMDFAPLIAEAKPEMDPLASLIPADQHAVFFLSFDALVRTLDRAQREGSSLAGLIDDSTTGDAQTQQRYERQLCLSLDSLARAIGPALVDSVAITGSDPYLRVGSDVAILLQTRNAQALAQLLALQAEIARTDPNVKAVDGEIDGIAYTGVVRSDRIVCSYRATFGNAMVVTNSLAQLRQLVAVQRGAASLAGLPEYVYFRQRYQRGHADESALLILSDATIRRWCGPRWRIADSRRTRAAASLAEAQAEHAAAIVKHAPVAATTQPALAVPGLEEIQVTPYGAVSTIYGSLTFMTPIVELDMQRVTEGESRSYAQWRNNYQRNWRWAFDPIAVRIGVTEDRLTCDLTVIPLIASSNYRQFIAITSGASLKPGSADPHDAIAHLAVAINPDSDTLRSWGRLMQNFSGNLRVEPLAWLGSCVALYADPDPFWDELAQAPDSSSFMRDNTYRLPVALYAESRDPLRLAAFLTAARAFVEQSAPGIATWETLDHNGRPYVKISANGEGKNSGFLRAIYYAATPNAWIISLNEQVIHRALDRQAAATQPSTRPAHEWLGGNLSLHLSRQIVEIFEKSARSEMASAAQVQAWTNIPILNEWKRQFPDQDPAEVHQLLFGVRLMDATGQGYVWNDTWKTMESTVYGHAGQPKPGPGVTEILNRYSGDMGITFEHGGLRAQAMIQRRPQP